MDAHGTVAHGLCLVPHIGHFDNEIDMDGLERFAMRSDGSSKDTAQRSLWR